ncbi:hypothetical protein PG990_010948 [Apiospora arundinis]
MVVFRLLDSIRKHHLALRYAGRHLFWTAPALYGYWTPAAQTRVSYQDGPLCFARTVREYLRDEKEKTRKLRQQGEELRDQQRQQQKQQQQEQGQQDPKLQQQQSPLRASAATATAALVASGRWTRGRRWCRK